MKKKRELTPKEQLRIFNSRELHLAKMLFNEGNPYAHGWNDCFDTFMLDFKRMKKKLLARVRKLKQGKVK